MAEDKRPPKLVIIPAPIWLISFGDTIALMLAFFVLLFSMSSVEKAQISQIFASISSSEPGESREIPVPNSNRSIQNVKVYDGLSMEYIYELLVEKINDSRNLDSVEVTLINGSVLISLPSSIFYSKEDPRINEEGKKILFEIGLILAPISNIIQVEGHESPQTITDETPFTNRWEMRILRASAVAQEIRRSGLLAPTKILGSPLDNFSTTPFNRVPVPQFGDDGVDLRVTRYAGGQ